MKYILIVGGWVAYALGMWVALIIVQAHQERTTFIFGCFLIVSIGGALCAFEWSIRVWKLYRR